jgi:hypothetical protein
VHPTRALASLFPAATHSHFVTRPVVHGLPSLRFSRAIEVPQSWSTSTRESHEMRNTGNVDATTASSSPSDGSISAVSAPSYAACPCPHAIQLLEVAANALRQRQILSPLHQRAVLRPQGHDKLPRGTVSCVRASARIPCRSLIARTTTHPAWDSLRLMAHSRRVNAKIPLAFFLNLHLSRVLGNRYLVLPTAVRHPLHESVALSDPDLVRRIPAQVRHQAAAGLHDTIPMSQFLVHHWRMDVPAHTA